MNMVVASMSLADEMVSTLAQNAIDVGSIPTLSAIFPIFTTIHNIGCNDYDPVQATCCMDFIQR